MCGIAAVFSRHRPIDPLTIAAGTAALHHRGPDGRQHWMSPDRCVALGHTRLSIIDLATGDQPIANEDGTLHLIHNGEFYDFEGLRERLIARGHRFRTKSDSEIALHLYEDLGPECVHHLRGEFAFIIWDTKNQRLFAARDRFGVKPLFYAHQGEALYLASEVKALFAMGVRAEWSLESVYAGGFIVPGERTLFKHVHNVPPGHFMRATAESFRVHQYWDVDYPHETARVPRTDQAYIDGFREVLEGAVKTRLRADVPVGCYLSGGTVYHRQKHPFLSPPSTLHPHEPLHVLMQDTLRSAAARDVPFLDQAKMVAALDDLADPAADRGGAVVMDQVLTVAMSYVFMHEGLKIAS